MSHAPDWFDNATVTALHQVDRAALGPEMLPPAEHRLRALTYFPPAATRVVILGQDPYHAVLRGDDVGEVYTKANGLSFGIDRAWRAATGYTPHSSFANILGELGAGGWDLPEELWTLEHWARQGVLLLNTRLTTAPGRPLAAAGLGWERVVQALLSQVPRDLPVAWLAWGREAADVVERHAAPSHLVVASTHPCRYSATRATAYLEAFVGSSCFARANDYLWSQGVEPIVWGPKRGGAA